MTTIALDKTHIAWDSQVTAGFERLGVAVDKVWVAGKTVYAFAGAISMLDAVVDWHRKGARPGRGRDLLDAGWELIVITAKETRYYSNESLFPMKVEPPFAIGSGSAFARGALLAGAPAYTAVRIAAECDTGTGGEINVRALKELV
jgi:ATP-dependent protease HslVU (ClpYQ) peptidase subunit